MKTHSYTLPRPTASSVAIVQADAVPLKAVVVVCDAGIRGLCAAPRHVHLKHYEDFHIVDVYILPIFYIWL